MKALLIGASGGLAREIGRGLAASGWEIDLLTRPGRDDAVKAAFSVAIAAGLARVFIAHEGYDAFPISEDYDAIFMLQALFAPQPLVEMKVADILDEISVGLTGPITITRAILARYPATADKRRDFCYIGSTSAYAGFRNTATYCAVKHGLLGFIRAMNDEYAGTDSRFWLFSMGTMNTEMGMKVTGQDPTSFLSAAHVARRIISAISDQTNNFEPEIIMRRRTIRLKAG